MRKLKIEKVKYEGCFSFLPYLWLDDPDVIAFGWLWWDCEFDRKPKE